MRKEEFYREAIHSSTGPLEGIRVLEATTTQAGPVAGMLLADLGAESIKIDRPDFGEIGRYARPYIKGHTGLEASTFYQCYNRNKRGITLELSSSRGQELFKQLARKCDVVIENYRPGTMEKWGLGYSEIRKIKPDIIYTSVSGFGQFGPLHHKPGYDPVGQAMSGLLNANGYPDSPPTRFPNAMADSMAGWQAALGTVAALHYRERTGRGQHVDSSLVDAMLYLSEMGIMGAAHADFQWERMGSTHPTGTISVYPAVDGHVIILPGLQSHWERMVRVMGREELLDDPRVNTLPARLDNLEYAAGIIAEWSRDHTVQEVVERLEAAQITVSPILNFAQVLKNEHIRERDMVAEVEHPTLGPIKSFGVGPKFSLTPAKLRQAAPRLGEHNREIYQGVLELSDLEMEELRGQKVI